MQKVLFFLTFIDPQGVSHGYSIESTLKYVVGLHFDSMYESVKCGG